MLAEERYRTGHPFIIKSSGLAVDGVIEYETDDGRLAIAANQAIGKMLGMDEAVKSEVTIEERPYRSLTDEELAEKARELSGGENAK